MRVVVLYNPKSGKGRGEQMASAVRDALTSLGAKVELFAPAVQTPGRFLAEATERFRGADLVVVAGGDGTVHRALPVLVAAGAPMYHLAMGTENLFARQFGMTRMVETLEAAVKSGKTVEVDIGLVSINGAEPAPFALMCGVGPDASVIRRLDAVRTGPISHMSYIKPIAAELANPWLPRIVMDVDGERIAGQGIAIVANSRQYAVRLDPAMKASMTDGLLDVVLLPATGRLSLAACVARSRLRNHSKNTVYKHGRRIRLEVEGETPAYQVDGECGKAPPGRLTMEFQVRPKALKVLTP